MTSRIHEVWLDNLEAELVALRHAIDSFPVVSMYVAARLSSPHLGPITDSLLPRVSLSE
jgi:hypothetical protein